MSISAPSNNLLSIISPVPIHLTGERQYESTVSWTKHNTTFSARPRTRTAPTGGERTGTTAPPMRPPRLVSFGRRLEVLNSRCSTFRQLIIECYLRPRVASNAHPWAQTHTKISAPKGDFYGIKHFYDIGQSNNKLERRLSDKNATPGSLPICWNISMCRLKGSFHIILSARQADQQNLTWHYIKKSPSVENL